MGDFYATHIKSKNFQTNCVEILKNTPCMFRNWALTMKLEAVGADNSSPKRMGGILKGSTLKFVWEEMHWESNEVKP